MKKIFVVILILFSLNLTAEESRSFQNNKNTSIETSPLMAYFHYYAIRCNRSLSEKGDLLFGFAYLNTEWADQGQLHAYTLLTGYRHYLWKGFHLEYELWSAYDPFVSKVDGETYRGVDFWHAVRAGYRFKIEYESASPYLILQIEVGRGLKRFNKWPEYENHTSVHPILLVGLLF